MIRITVQPFDQLVTVAARVVVSVVTVQKRDACNVFRNSFDAVEEAEHKTSTAAVPRENHFWVERSQFISHCVDDTCNQLIGVGKFPAPLRPAFASCFEIHYDDILPWHDLAESPRLCADMLDIEMPIQSIRHPSTCGLLNRISVWKRIEY